MGSVVKIEQEAGGLRCVNPLGGPEGRIVNGLDNHAAHWAANHVLVWRSETHPVAALGDLTRHIAARNIAKQTLAVPIADFVGVGQRK